MTATLPSWKTHSVVVLSVLLVVALLLPALWPKRVAAQSETFTFTAEGDIGSNSNSNASLGQVAQAGAAFSLALGDLGYVSSGGESAWCTRVKNIVGSLFPFELVAGNHEDDSRANGFIGKYVACLPDRMSATGAYGAEYYFDYGTARIILAAVDSSVNGINYNYNTVGSAHYNWMRDRIREAKAAGKWVIVGVHKNCITPRSTACDLGQNFVNLIHQERVDLFLQGHDHIYARSKQLTCATAGSYNAACVVDSDDAYARGAGTVTIISGITGQSQYDISASDVERNYFVKAMGGNGNWNFVTGAKNSGRGYGVTKVTVAADRMDVVWVPSVTSVVGWGGDSFSIVGTASSPTPSAPTNTSTRTKSPTRTPTNTFTLAGPTSTPMPPTTTPPQTETPLIIASTPEGPTPSATLRASNTPTSAPASPMASPTFTETPLPTLTATPGGSTTISFQEGVLPDSQYAGSRDTIIKQSTGNTNYGSAITLEVDGDDSGADKTLLIKWDTTGIPAGKTVTAASIVFQVVNATSNTYQLYEVKRNWDENQAAWNFFVTGGNWQAPGAFGANDRGSTVLGTVGPVSANTFATISLNASGRALVQNWINNPSLNFGLLIGNATNGDGLYFSSSEDSAMTHRPKLRVTYQ